MRPLLWLGCVLAMIGTSCQAPFQPVAQRPSYDEPAPANSRLVEPRLPQSIRHFALSPDRRRVAYSEDGKYPREIYVATLGGEARKVGVIRPDVLNPQWTADGSALLYVDILDREVPGQYDDWDVPSREILSHKLMRLPADGGAPEELLSFEGEIGFQAATKTNEVFFSVREKDNGGMWSTIHRLDLGTRQQEEALKAEAIGSFRVSPDGNKVVVNEIERAEGYRTVWKVFDLATKEATLISPSPAGPMKWAADSETLLAFSPKTTGGTLTIQQFSATGAALEPRVITLAGQTELGTLHFVLRSPDDRHLLANAGRTNVVINLETGALRLLNSFGYFHCWLDERTLMGAYQGGQYAVEISEEIERDDGTPASSSEPPR